MFKLRDKNKLWYVNGPDSVELTTKKGLLRTVDVIKTRLEKDHLKYLDFAVDATPRRSVNLDKRNVWKPLNEADHMQKNPEMIKMGDLMSVLNGTQKVISETSFNGAFTEQERRVLNLELQTVHGNLKLLESKRIFYDSEIVQAEAKVKSLKEKRALP